MGGSESKHEPAPARAPTPEPIPVPPKPLYDDPWRTFNDDIWTQRYHDKILSGLKDCFTGTKSVKTANVVLLGPINSGKSAFVNSILSIGNNSVMSTADSGSADKSYTTKLGVYKHRCGEFGNVRLFDTMGLEPEQYEGFNIDDVTLLLKGHVPKDYKFNPRNPITPDDKAYIKKPKASDKAHCVVFCVRASLVRQDMPKDLRRKIAQMQEHLKELGIPRIVLVTHIDEVCEEVSKQIKTLFYSKAVEDAVKKAATAFQVAPSYIHPVENYHKSPETNQQTNVPLLLALRHMLDLADDYFVRTHPGEERACCIC